MKFEPLITVASFFTVGTLSITRDGQYSYEFMMALAGGSFITLLASYWKSRVKKSNGVDTALWATIATVGSFFLAYFFAPIVEGMTIPGTSRELTLGGAAFAIAVSGAPVIEWVVTGGAWKILQKFIDKWVESKS